MKRILSRRERIQYIHDRVSGKLGWGKFKFNPGYWAIAEELGTTFKTIKRDADFMRDDLGLPLEYDESRCCLYYRGGWQWISDVFNLADSLADVLLPL